MVPVMTKRCNFIRDDCINETNQRKQNVHETLIADNNTRLQQVSVKSNFSQLGTYIYRKNGK